ncbi:antitoxin Xre/MbcA/ParS toxin-binding domain-containing protein [Sphingomonas sp. CFBP 13720]|uniref:antitoxin Xre/MbcA/ParS toxin-binding domain-containing protein n=1 Tax=Sphingomonas sp. CFBP 13720 TaxID=2775302 RepID=UPI001786462D|nr:antitoxin Xre/MbcA/ParS toxin-binding domain-containing protein [Sphingomonas sp. CFBP 13720]MBD8679825.1 DUF2384 domain-containing protein [Sphingomonas sp. CFBP 13720]
MSALDDDTRDEAAIDAPADSVDTPDDGVADAPPADAAVADDTRKPQSMRFRRKFTTVRLTPEQAARQGQVATTAFRLFGERDAAVAFLNAHDDDLGGRPLDLAIASAEGLATVEASMAARTA